MLTAAGLLDAFLAQIEIAYDDEPNIRCVAQPGENLITDWCAGSCAMAYVRVASLGVSTTGFPETDVAGGRGGPLAATFHLGVARCVAMMDEQGNPPAPEQQTAEARQFLTDAQTLRRVVACTILEQRPHLYTKTVGLGTWTPQGPEGGCAGGYWPVSTRVS